MVIVRRGGLYTPAPEIAKIAGDRPARARNRRPKTRKHGPTTTIDAGGGTPEGAWVSRVSSLLFPSLSPHPESQNDAKTQHPGNYHGVEAGSNGGGLRHVVPGAAGTARVLREP